MKKSFFALVLAMVFAFPAAAVGPAGGGPGGGVDINSLPFPLIAGQMACYDDAMASGNPVERYADWRSASPANCQTRWEDVPKDRRKHG